jgi:hypothetical protein
MEAAMDTQTELEQLRAEVAELRKALGNKQQLPAPKPPSLIDNDEFVLAMARYSEGLEGYSEQEVRRRWGNLTEKDWVALGDDARLVERIQEAKMARVKSGAAKRERAQQHVVAAVDVVNGIVTDSKANARHRIDGAKLLDSMAGFRPDAPTDEEHVIVTINLGSDVLRFGGAIRPTPNGGEIIDGTPGPIPGFMLPPNKDDGGGNPI